MALNLVAILLIVLVITANLEAPILTVLTTIMNKVVAIMDLVVPVTMPTELVVIMEVAAATTMEVLEVMVAAIVLVLVVATVQIIEAAMVVAAVMEVAIAAKVVVTNNSNKPVTVYKILSGTYLLCPSLKRTFIQNILK